VSAFSPPLTSTEVPNVAGLAFGHEVDQSALLDLLDEHATLLRPRQVKALPLNVRVGIFAHPDCKPSYAITLTVSRLG
jgi:hypothetical protein